MRKNFWKLLSAILLTLGLMATIHTPATAGDKWMGASPPAQEWGPGWFVRLRGLGVIPDEDSSNITANGAPLVANISVDNSIVPELDISYFFTSHIAVELILAVTPHDIAGGGTLQGDLGDTWLLPPTLLAQYHFNPGGRVKPYVGAGLNYTVFFNEDDSGAFLPNAGLTVSDLDLDNGFGVALQAGADIHIRDNMYLNIDVKKLWLDTDATVQTTAGAIVRADVDIDPWIIGVGIGWKIGGGAIALK